MRHGRGRNVEAYGAVLPPFYWCAMTEPYDLGKEEEVRFDTYRRPPWIERVRAADAAAERAYDYIFDEETTEGNRAVVVALIAIAAELRAARIARRPGVGQNYNDIPGAGQRGC